MNGNGNEPLEMGGNVIKETFPAHVCCTMLESTQSAVSGRRSCYRSDSHHYYVGPAAGDSFASAVDAD